MTYLRSLLSLNIDRAVTNSREGCGEWVREVSVRRDFEANMVFDCTSFHGFSFLEMQSLLQAEIREEYEEENLEDQEGNYATS